MKKLREYKISVAAFSVALVLFGVSFVTGLIPDLVFAINKICMYLGFAFFNIGLVLSMKCKENNDDNE